MWKKLYLTGIELGSSRTEVDCFNHSPKALCMCKNRNKMAAKTILMFIPLTSDPSGDHATAWLQQDELDRHGEHGRIGRGRIRSKSDPRRIGLHQRELCARLQGSQDVDLRSGSARPHGRRFLEDDPWTGGSEFQTLHLFRSTLLHFYSALPFL